MAHPVLRAVVCDDRDDMRRTVAALVERCGIKVEATVASVTALLAVVGQITIDVTVLSLPVCGPGGLSAITAVHKVAAQCQVIALCPFEGLAASAHEAGARALVGEEDLRALETVLLAVASEGLLLQRFPRRPLSASRHWWGRTRPPSAA